MNPNLPWILAAVLPLLISSMSRAAAAPERDLAYGPDPLQRLDLVLPHGTGFPTVIFVHGGSLTTGDKGDDDYKNACAPFPEAGIACASVNYRLAPKHAWPAQADDVAAAVAWVRAKIGSRGGDPRKLVLMGHSSGALLAALVGSDPRFLARHQLEASTIGGVIPMGSIMWDDELDQAVAEHGLDRVSQGFARDPDNAMYGGLEAYQDHWPIRHVRAGMPAFLFLIAEAEQEHPPVLKTNKKFVEDARAKGNAADYKVLPDRTHYSAIRKFAEPGDPVFALVRDFVLGLGAPGR
jgi:acetyl esterase/lipase